MKVFLLVGLLLAVEVVSFESDKRFTIKLPLDPACRFRIPIF